MINTIFIVLLSCPLDYAVGAPKPLRLTGTFVHINAAGDSLPAGEINGDAIISSRKEKIELTPELKKRMELLMAEKAKKDKKKGNEKNTGTENDTKKKDSDKEKEKDKDKARPRTDFLRADGTIDFSKNPPASWSFDMTDPNVLEVKNGKTFFDMRPKKEKTTGSVLQEKEIAGTNVAYVMRNKPDKSKPAKDKQNKTTDDKHDPAMEKNIIAIAPVLEQKRKEKPKTEQTPAKPAMTTASAGVLDAIHDWRALAAGEKGHELPESWR